MKITDMKKTIITAIIILISGITAYAQQDAMFTHYAFNTLAINPGYAGSRDALTVTALHRQQWVGFDGAPVTQTATLHSPIIRKNIGIGLSFINDKIGPVNMTSFYLDFSFTIKITETSKLAFGLKTGANMMNTDLNSLELADPGDPAFQTDVANKFMPNFGAGLYYHTDRYYVGFSVPKLLENDFDVTSGQINSGEAKHYFLIGGTYFDLNNDFKIKPTTFIKVTEAAPVEADITALLIYQNLVWGGLMYRTGDAIGALAGVNITPQLAFGYSFDWSMINQTSRYNNGSHEIMIRYDFFYLDEKKIRSPRYF